ncbi:MAG: septum formation initiator family protein [Bauldia sp.]
MLTRQRKRRRFTTALILPVVAAAFFAYFGYWGLHGDYGLLAEEQLTVDAARLQVELDGLRRQVDDYKRRIALLGRDGLEADMLDERARAALDMARPDEIVIPNAALPARR